jgi:hypothetical protein
MATSEVGFYFNVIIDANFSIGSFLLPLIIYLILRHSKQMHRYKYFLLNVVIFMYFLHFCAFLLKPRFLIPHYCMEFQPLIPMNRQVLWVALNFMLLVMINTETGLFGLILYRYLKTFTNRLSRGQFVEIMIAKMGINQYHFLLHDTNLCRCSRQ